jgi:hypothetical protein
MRHFFIGLLIIAVKIFPQAESIQINDYDITIENGNMIVSEEGNPLLEISFNSPSGLLADLDDDSSEEFLIIDNTSHIKKLYSLYIFNTTGDFFLVDSIMSGTIEPYITTSEEVGSLVIVTGNPKFLNFQSVEDNYLPIDCWKFDGGELYNVNDEIYEIYIAENDGVIPELEEYFNINNIDCNSILKHKALIISVYVNYINAGEHSLASQFLKKYYLCSDIEEFKKTLDDLLSEEEL